MGHKKVCFTCRKAFSLFLNQSENINLACPECGKQTTILSKEFRPPSQGDIKKWKVVEFLKDHGFTYYHVYKVRDNGVSQGQLKYPETMKEAKEFVVKYKDQAYGITYNKADT